MNAHQVLVPPVVVAKAVGVKPATVLAWFRRGWIPGYRAGRRPVLFDLSEVRSALAARAAADQPAKPEGVDTQDGGAR